MAVRFDASGENYTATVTLGSQTAFSCTWWVKLGNNRATWSSAWCLDNGASTDFVNVETNSGGAQMFYWDDIGAKDPGNMPVLTVGTWYFFGVAVNGVNGTIYWRDENTPTLTSGSWTTGSASTTMSNLRIGNNVFGTEWLDGCVTAYKLWTGVTFSQAEIDVEGWQHVPVRSANLQAWYPLIIPETRDYSGNSRTLSGGSGTTQESGPNILWATPRPPAVNSFAIQRASNY
jgi:hypothetical protein